MAPNDFIMTIDSDAEDSAPDGKAKSKIAQTEMKVRVVEESATEKDTLNPEFHFDLAGDIYAEVLNGNDALGDLVKGSKRVCSTLIKIYIALIVLLLFSRNPFQ